MNTSESKFNRRVLLAVDDSENSERAVDYVGRMLGGLDNFKIALLHVVVEPEADFFKDNAEMERWLSCYRKKNNSGFRGLPQAFDRLRYGCEWYRHTGENEELPLIGRVHSVGEKKAGIRYDRGRKTGNVQERRISVWQCLQQNCNPRPTLHGVGGGVSIFPYHHFRLSSSGTPIG
jgi:hypothetical protein